MENRGYTGGEAATCSVLKLASHGNGAKASWELGIKVSGTAVLIDGV